MGDNPLITKKIARFSRLLPIDPKVQTDVKMFGYGRWEVTHVLQKKCKIVTVTSH